MIVKHLQEVAIMNVSLTPELEQFIAEQVESGRYRSASEAIRAGIRLLADEARERAAKIDYLRAAAEKGVLELERKEGIPGERVFEELLAELEPKP
jgi:antitoxin ParD1/3/4